MNRTVLKYVLGGSIALAVSACDPEQARELAKAVFLSSELPSSAGVLRNEPSELKRQRLEIFTEPEGRYQKPSTLERSR